MVRTCAASCSRPVPVRVHSASRSTRFGCDKIGASHMRIRLLPDSPLGWTPYAWLVYLSLYIVAAAVTSRTPADWAMNGAGLLVFLVLYFRGFWVQGHALLRIALALVALGVVLSPYNMGASVFFIYGAAFLGDALRPGAAVRWLLAMVAIIALEGWLVPLDVRTW